MSEGKGHYRLLYLVEMGEQKVVKEERFDFAVGEKNGYSIPPEGNELYGMIKVWSGERTAFIPLTRFVMLEMVRETSLR